MKARAAKRRTEKSRSQERRKRVGVFKYRLELAATAEGPFRAVEALVDTGSVYTWVPASILLELGLTPTDKLEFTMANGKRELRDAAEAVVRLDGRIRHTVCVFGEADDLVLLGAYALEGFGLAADPLNKRLVPMPTIPAAGMSESRITPRRRD